MNFYVSAAFALDHLDKHQGSVKGSLSAAGVDVAAGGESKRILALIIETLKYRSVIERILTAVPINTLEKQVFPRKQPPRTPTSLNLLHVLLHDLLFSSRLRIEASDKWPPKQAINRHQARLRAELVRIQIREGKASVKDLGKQPEGGESCRYIRWNPNIDDSRQGDWSWSALLKHLVTLGFTQMESPDYPVPLKSFFTDGHLETVLVFSSTTNWWVNDPWYESGAIILQDKASCFPAKVLMEGWSQGECLDATAAPGNKTSYISALMGNKGTIHAFERSSNRFVTLQKMLARAHCTNVHPQRADFTESNPADYPGVTRILLDPSCSGSGIVNRLDYLVQEETATDSERLDKLATFQFQMILHAFKFPSVERIVYSTCSIHPEEDEQVVMKALKSPLAKEHNWSLATRDSVLASWPRRGRPEEMGDLADRVIRCLPGVDKTNGFFVACFVKGQQSKKRRFEPENVISLSQSVPTSVKIGDDNVGDASGPGQPELAPLDRETDAHVAAKNKTQAQLERNRRKKQQQKKRKVA